MFTLIEHVEGFLKLKFKVLNVEIDIQFSAYNLINTTVIKKKNSN